MQTKDELEKFYQRADPWNYKTLDCDRMRKATILEFARLNAPVSGQYLRALDIGCGEAWITKDLPAIEKWGYEISDMAASRFPLTVKRANPPEGKYDLVIANGVIYPEYEYKALLALIKAHASSIVITSHIESREMLDEIKTIGEEISHFWFPYSRPEMKHAHQSLRVIKV